MTADVPEPAATDTPDVPAAPRTGDPAVDAVLDRLHDALAAAPGADLETRRQLFDAAHRDLRTLLDPPAGDLSPAPTLAPAPVVREPDEW